VDIDHITVFKAAEFILIAHPVGSILHRKIRACTIQFDFSQGVTFAAGSQTNREDENEK
jgi:hypothetical protein